MLMTNREWFAGFPDVAAAGISAGPNAPPATPDRRRREGRPESATRAGRPRRPLDTHTSRSLAGSISSAARSPTPGLSETPRRRLRRHRATPRPAGPPLKRSHGWRAAPPAHNRTRPSPPTGAARQHRRPRNTETKLATRIEARAANYMPAPKRRAAKPPRPN